jgi:hypothetical protein
MRGHIRTSGNKANRPAGGATRAPVRQRQATKQAARAAGAWRGRGVLLEADVLPEIPDVLNGRRPRAGGSQTLKTLLRVAGLFSVAFLSAPVVVLESRHPDYVT